ncbi:MAG: hypothetical protein QOG33_520 [Gaiellales bacterium]|jgi:hypothetical protein|nr:hypothetical protein [Gaiellales bacterium]
MSDLEPGQHEEIARRLRDEGLAQAPPDMAGEVMRRVRSEPRRRTSSVRRPLTNLLAAAVIIAALVAGVAKLGGSGSGSASGGGSVPESHAGATSAGAPAKSADTRNSILIPGVPLSALHGTGALAQLGPIDSYQGMCLNDRIARRRGVTLSVPVGSFSAVKQQLSAARKLLPSDTPRVQVRLRGLAAGAASRFSVTCP